ncbi:hypothetical protein [Sanyastnella coralliicola]|uniref:hypothetical protein n=1 Tax=Sanyastnella coralliicola TaxID=3069118 RepID=UPI0027B9B9C6|nr:hypothetical protein [Longitalea sp. SCSIO 12813]
MKIPYLRLLLPTLVLFMAVHGLDFLFAVHNPSGGGVDGIKNLYTFAWYADNNESFTNFEGMAEPFGEHVFYTDGHPALGFFWKPIAQLLGVKGLSAHLLSFLIHLSWLLTPIPLFLLFRHFKIRHGIAIAGAIGFTLLAPQILRDGGHYALAYTIALPLSWWLTTRALRDGLPWKQLIVLTLIHTWWLGTHAYLGVMTIGFSSLLLGIEWLRSIRNWKRLLAPIITGVIPMILFLGFLNLTDAHSCRLDTPYGYFDFLSSPRSIFFPQTGPLAKYTAQLGWNTKWEGWSYIGLSAGLMLISFIFWGYQAVRKQQVTWVLVILPSLIAAGVLFLVACGQPFIWIGRSSIENFPVLEQFRGIGRFAWPFYFVLTTLALIMLETFVANRPKAVGTPISVAFFLLLAFEGLYHQRSLDTLRSDVEHPFSFSAPAAYENAVNSINASETDVLLPLPYFHVGSEVYGRFVDGNMEEVTLLLSYHTGKPTFGAHLTRASLNESRQLLEILASAPSPKTIGQELDLAQQVCMINDGTPMDPDEQHWWDRGVEFYNENGIALRSLPLSELIQRSEGAYAPFRPKGENQLDSNEVYVFEPFDTLEQGIQWEGNGHAEYPCDGISVVYSTEPDSSWLGKRFMATLYMRGPEDACLAGKYQLNAQLIAQYATGDQVDWVALNTPKQASEHPMNGQWAKTYVTFDMTEAIPERLDIMVKGEWRCEGPIKVDALEIEELTN